MFNGLPKKSNTRKDFMEFCKKEYDFIPKMKKKKKKNDIGCSSLIQSTRNPHYYKVLLILCPVWPTQQTTCPNGNQSGFLSNSAYIIIISVSFDTGKHTFEMFIEIMEEVIVAIFPIAILQSVIQYTFSVESLNDAILGDDHKIKYIENPFDEGLLHKTGYTGYFSKLTIPDNDCRYCILPDHYFLIIYENINCIEKEIKEFDGVRKGYSRLKVYLKSTLIKFLKI
ncbi:hypothetical protein H8356DRAFT_1321466 [Neocallimastix lanati (nom. inval.)]|nr:hypothetical protein H8356DRAFT_1321466 [Neocallimastix sp. JGI-2020a]